MTVQNGYENTYEEERMEINKYDFCTSIKNDYKLEISDISLLDSHFGTEIYLMIANNQKYIVKKLPLCFENVNNEGVVSDYLASHGIKVARLLQNNTGHYVLKTSEYQLTVQEYIEGEILQVNRAPKWLMGRLAEYLGRATLVLKDFEQLPLRFGKEFFSPGHAIAKKEQYVTELARTKDRGDSTTIPIWEEQIRHLEKISTFHIDTDKLTYTNSHGDYHIGQVIVQDKDITVIDWTSACQLPICFEIITSYVFAAPSCSEGVIDAEGLKSYIQTFTKYFPLTEYDIKAMPYVLYFWHCMCNYRPDEIACIAPKYQPIANLLTNMLNWLYEHVDELSDRLTLSSPKGARP